MITTTRIQHIRIFFVSKTDKGKLPERAGRKVMDLRQFICYGRQIAGFYFFNNKNKEIWLKELTIK
jgi:hypothetical protein